MASIRVEHTPSRQLLKLSRRGRYIAAAAAPARKLKLASLRAVWSSKGCVFPTKYVLYVQFHRLGSWLRLKINNKGYIADRSWKSVLAGQGGWRFVISQPGSFETCSRAVFWSVPKISAQKSVLRKHKDEQGNRVPPSHGAGAPATDVGSDRNIKHEANCWAMISSAGVDEQAQLPSA